MDAVKPLALYGFSMATMMGALYLERQRRPVLLIPTWTALAISFKDIHKLPSTLGLNVQLGMLIIITFLYSPVLFSASTKPLDVTKPFMDLPSAYRLFNNPRAITLLPPQTRTTSNSRRLRFAASGIGKATLIVACRTILDHVLAPHLASCTLQDFAPSKELIVPRLFLGDFTSRELAIRTHVALSWILETYANLTLCHIVLGIFFVTLLRVDEPEEWPTLFNSPLEAYTLRRFWGRFWHRLITPSATAWARVIASRVPFLRNNKTLAKLFVAFFIFTVSGLAHVLVGWRLGDTALEQDLYFFWVSFAAIGVEISLSKVTGKANGEGSHTSSVWRTIDRVLGYAWVISFFVLAIPHVLFPKMYSAIIAKMFSTIFSFKPKA